MTQLPTAMHPRTQTKAWTANTAWVKRPSYTREGQGKGRSPQPQWEDSCRWEADPHSKDSTVLRKAALHLVLGFGFAAKENNSGTHTAKTIKNHTEKWPSEQVISGRQTRMKGQRLNERAKHLSEVIDIMYWYIIQYIDIEVIDSSE